jgi:hypothetical protein
MLSLPQTSSVTDGINRGRETLKKAGKRWAPPGGPELSAQRFNGLVAEALPHLRDQKGNAIPVIVYSTAGANPIQC